MVSSGAVADLVWVSSGGSGGTWTSSVVNDRSGVQRRQWRTWNVAATTTDLVYSDDNDGVVQWWSRGGAGAERMCSSGGIGERATAAAKDDMMTMVTRTTATTELVEGASAANPASARGADWTARGGVEQMTRLVQRMTRLVQADKWRPRGSPSGVQGLGNVVTRTTREDRVVSRTTRETQNSGSEKHNPKREQQREIERNTTNWSWTGKSTDLVLETKL
ncbi:hypothetical protein Scep_002535 [Stephania cephalantha]|uniref:Uncharacterized protein n=1 Tax=Stephania cephalantha TaxID=152367 RepID=A0AAP0LEM9_9MAGN